MTGITFTRTLGTIAAAGVAVAAPLAIGAGTASADGHDWSGVADCESGGNWSTNTGNGYYGGLQFNQQTWSANGGSGSPANASKSEQIRVAENVLDTQGAGAWPVCGQNLTSGGGGTQNASYDQGDSQQGATQQDTSQQSTDQGASEQQGTTIVQNEDGTYTVQFGDTLSKIAAKYGVSLDQLAPQVENVDLIFPGKVLDMAS